MESGNIGDFLAQLRNKKKLKQTEVANYIGTTDKTISKWEHGNNLPDTAYLAKLSEIYDVEIEEILNARINTKRRLQIKRNKLINKIIMYSSFVLIPIFIILLIFFCIEYKSYKVYQVLSKSENNIINGYIIKKNNNLFINASLIQIDGYYLKTDDLIIVEIYYKDKLIYSTNEQYFSLNIKDNVNINNLVIKTSIENDKVEKKSNIKLVYYEITNSYKDNQININKTKISNKNIEDKLIKFGFKENEEGKLIYKKGNLNVEYIKNGEIVFNFVYKDKIYNENIKYYNSSGSLSCTIYKINEDNKIMLEKYSYDIKNKNLSCTIGDCSTVEDVLKLIEPYVTLLNG